MSAELDIPGDEAVRLATECGQIISNPNFRAGHFVRFVENMRILLIPIEEDNSSEAKP